MALIITPQQLQRRAELYQQISQLTSAGVTLVSALELLQRNPPAGLDKAPLGCLLEGLRKGETFSDSLRATGRWLPPFDVALLHAGEQSGRLPECFRLLSNEYANRARLARQMIGALAYPFFLLHFAVFLFPFPQFFLSGNLAAYLAKTLGLLLPIYVLAFALVHAFQGRRGEAWRETMEKLVHPVPLLGAARRALALSRLASALEALLNAGVTVIEAWQIAALASGSPTLRRAVASWDARLSAGQTPADILGQTQAFPEVFANLYRSGEISGKLDESLGNLHRYYEEEGTRKMQLLVQWAPRLFYLLIVLGIAIKIVQFWLGYFQQINEAIKAVP
jgi:type II secretory pathway component PulF